MLKRFIVQKAGESPWFDGVEGPTMYIDIDGKKIAYFDLATDNYGSIKTVVAGIAVSDEYREESGVPVIDVEMIRDPQLQDKVKAALKSTYRKWPSSFTERIGRLFRKVLFLGDKEYETPIKFWS